MTRTVLINIIKSLGFKLIEKEFSLKELYKSDEVFITSSGSLITPIIQIDSIKINNKKESVKRLKKMYGQIYAARVWNLVCKSSPRQ